MRLRTLIEGRESATFPGTIRIVQNAGSGSRDNEELRVHIESRCAQAGRRCVFHVVGRDGSVAAVTREAVRLALQEEGIVVAAGGDGTISAVADVVVRAGCAMGILPQGTFNFFGRSLGLDGDADMAMDALLLGRLRPVQLGCVNDRHFIVNASVGLYPQLLEDRESFKRRLGRHRIVALCSALATMFRVHPVLHWEVTQPDDPGLAVRRQMPCRDAPPNDSPDAPPDDAPDAPPDDAPEASPDGPWRARGFGTLFKRLKPGGHRTRPLSALTLFVGNNALQLTRIGIDGAELAGHGALVAVALRPVGRLRLFWLLLRSAAGRAGESDDLTSFAFRSLLVRPRHGRPDRPTRLAVDGESLKMRWPLTFGMAEAPLWLMTRGDESASVAPGLSRAGTRSEMEAKSKVDGQANRVADAPGPG